jgi:bifunctional DNA-binding transcriptional regulator/antitoxin component of YhaV-PrlF toxin-antitoxin module
MRSLDTKGRLGLPIGLLRFVGMGPGDRLALVAVGHRAARRLVLVRATGLRMPTSDADER